jgi:hypothetical protein
MLLGHRRIRSAGRASGSIEITLPTDLHPLEGLQCRVVVRDGPRPEIVLQPDLSGMHGLFQALWEKLRNGLHTVGDIGEFSMQDFSVSLFPTRHWQERPPLTYIDALSLRQMSDTDGKAVASEALPRVLAFLTIVAAYRLQLEGQLAMAFGDAVAYLSTGIPVGLGTDFERGMAHRVFWREELAEQRLRRLWDDVAWESARGGLLRVYRQFDIWQHSPEVYESARSKWYRALDIEMGMGIPTPAFNTTESATSE